MLPWAETSTEFLEPPATTAEALRIAGVDFRVTREGLYFWPEGPANINTAVDSGHTALVISSLAEVVDLDRKGELLQNEEAFGFIDDLGYRIAAIGMMDGKTWVLTRWIAHDEQTVEYMVLFVNDYTRVTAYMFGFDGVIINPHNIGAGHQYVVNPSIYSTDSLHTIIGSYFMALESVLEDLREETVLEPEVLAVFDRVMYPNLSKDTAQRDGAHLAVLCALKDGVPTEGAPISKLTALRAIYNYLDNDRRTRNDSDRFKRALFEPSQPKQKILSILQGL